MKISYGPLTNTDGVSKDIVINKLIPNKPIDILIGGLIIAAGVAYLTCTAFAYGTVSYENAEFDTMKDLGIIN